MKVTLIFCGAVITLTSCRTAAALRGMGEQVSGTFARVEADLDALPVALSNVVIVTAAVPRALDDFHTVAIASTTALAVVSDQLLEQSLAWSGVAESYTLTPTERWSIIAGLVGLLVSVAGWFRSHTHATRNERVIARQDDAMRALRDALPENLRVIADVAKAGTVNTKKREA